MFLPGFEPQSVQPVVWAVYHNYVYVLLFSPTDETEV